MILSTLDFVFFDSKFKKLLLIEEELVLLQTLLEIGCQVDAHILVDVVSPNDFYGNQGFAIFPKPVFIILLILLALASLRVKHPYALVDF